VIIANYVGSHSNCIGGSGFYSVCCKDECAGLLGHLERHLATPNAAPAGIVAHISNLRSSTVSVPQLSVTLLERLDEIATKHGGFVPIHSRLFAQWMHHIYPRECPFPHVSGTTNPQTKYEWEEEKGIQPLATDEEMWHFTNKSPTRTYHDIPWSTEDEMLVGTSGMFGSGTSAYAVVRGLMLFSVSSSLAFGLFQSFSILPMAFPIPNVPDKTL